MVIVALPIDQSEYILNRMCRNDCSECTKTELSMRHGSNSVSGGQYDSAVLTPPFDTSCNKNTTAVTPMIDQVTTGPSLRLARLIAVTTAGLAFGALWRASLVHSGQCTPTAACVWQPTQIVRPHRWHKMKL